MDYTQIPRSLIYKDRTNLKDFGVQMAGTLNHQLFSTLKEIYKATDRAQEIMLRSFNNAYYICTLIPFDDFPEIQVAEYERLLLDGNVYDREEICAVSMAMVTKLMPAFDSCWSQVNNDLINAIRHRFTHFQWMNIGARHSFEMMCDTCNTEGFILPKSEFAPRDIIEVIENFRESDLWMYAEYICERLAFLKDLNKRMYGADSAIARLRDYQRELCNDSGYNPKKDCFKYSDGGGLPLIRDLSFEEQVRNNYQHSQDAIDYYIEHYPKAENCHHDKQTEFAPSISDNKAQIAAQFQNRINELERCIKDKEQANQKLMSHVKELEAKLEETNQTINELTQPIEELTVKDKIRMALALQLLKEAGLTDKTMKVRGNGVKVAEIMSLLLNIASKNKRGNSAQICQTFLSDEGKYYPQTKDTETLIKLNKLCSELGIRACLSLEAQGNKKV